MRLPESILADEGVCENCELSHNGCDGDFWLFPAGDETVVEGFQVRIVPSGAVGGHIESGSDIGPSAFDGARSSALAAVIGDGGEADDHGDLFSGELAEFDHAGDESDSGARADAGDRGEDFEATGQGGIAVDPVADFGLEVGDAGFEGAQLTLELADQRSGLARADLVENGGSIFDRRVAPAGQFLKDFQDFWRQRAGLTTATLNPLSCRKRCARR